VIGARDLGKRFGARWVFKGLDFNVEPHQRLVILGPNGSGKSTLLKVLAGLLQPTMGSITSELTDYRTDIGYAALDMSLYAHLDPYEHLTLAARLRGCEARCDEMLDRVGLNHSRHLPASQLSTGLRMRLKLALALQPGPKVLMLDEPGASLDEAGRELLDGICQDQVAEGCVIIGTNDPRERRNATHELELA
jgi:ABC-type multidrug transport system ATPase subunit